MRKQFNCKKDAGIRINVKKQKPIQIRVLTAADLHQSRLHYRSLIQAAEKHRPDVVALVGDALYAFGRPGKHQFTAAECAKMLSELPVEHLLFVRGNHEDSNWTEFVAAWPHECRKLTALYGTTCTIGPLVILGFPCMTGLEFHWCVHLSAGSNDVELHPAQSRQPLPAAPETWLPKLMRRVGSAGRTLWLMHESPVGLPLANPRVFNPAWTGAAERFSPRLVIAGHDHDTPLTNGTWHARLGDSVAVNVGQAEMNFHYTVLDFEFAGATPCLPSRIRVRAFSWEQEVIL
jgi:Icc-related predicted phosphoesterase